jgi:hypothetical protein
MLAQRLMALMIMRRRLLSAPSSIHSTQARAIFPASCKLEIRFIGEKFEVSTVVASGLSSFFAAVFLGSGVAFLAGAGAAFLAGFSSSLSLESSSLLSSLFAAIFLGSGAAFLAGACHTRTAGGLAFGTGVRGLSVESP